ncbi:FAD-dependent oxidoreductase [Microbispora sp. RL4-1S]|uniref:FAD-dependent oxidoreductase n=1 Tax=Microbispora oryzae TaxID=2806554 RepID=A0A941AM69_9ACTN|nr:FAD-dependent oxidoreductase [Microbispora oryzae]MBP2707023.1 FAD-dependent oxidoreductase [Microbispora oryzae]
MPDTCDVAIIGGGVIGCAIAHRLGTEGRSVVLVEEGARLGLGASDAAMGGILTQTEPACLGPLSKVIKRSRDMYPGWLAELSGVSGLEVPLLEGGDIQVALDDAGMERLDTELLPRWKNSPFKVERLGPAEARELEPLLSEAVVGGFLLPDELALDPRELMSALAATLGRSGRVRVLTEARATAVTSGPRGARVYLASGDRVSADTVIVAAGHLSGTLLPALSEHLFPIRGVAYDARPPGVTGYALRHHVFAEFEENGVEYFPYLVPRHDGRVAVGVTYEENVGDPTVTEQALAEIRHGVAAMMPEAAAWPVGRTWAGLRPGSRDHMPLIGRVDGHRGVIVATGHSGLGVTLAPVTAELVSALVGGHIDDATRDLLEICRPDRDFSPRGAAEDVAVPR